MEQINVSNPVFPLLAYLALRSLEAHLKRWPVTRKVFSPVVFSTPANASSILRQRRLPRPRFTLYRIFHLELSKAGFWRPRQELPQLGGFLTWQRYQHRRSHSLEQFFRENDLRESPVFELNEWFPYLSGTYLWTLEQAHPVGCPWSCLWSASWGYH